MTTQKETLEEPGGILHQLGKIGLTTYLVELTNEQELDERFKPPRPKRAHRERLYRLPDLTPEYEDYYHNFLALKKSNEPSKCPK